MNMREWWTAKWPWLRDALRFLLGVGLIASMWFPAILVVEEFRGPTKLLAELKDAFGNWPPVGLLLAWMLAVPALGVYLVVEQTARAAQWARLRRRPCGQ